MEAQLVTVLMAEYNTPPVLLRTAIESVLAQSERRFELLIVDDGSSTDVRSVVDELDDDRIRVVGYEENRGLVEALNYGLSFARGEFIARMDTDDRAEPDYLESVLAEFAHFPDFAVVSGQAREVSDTGATAILGQPGEITPKLLMRGRAPIHPATIIRRRAIEAVGGYKNYYRAEDLALWCELLLAGYRLRILENIVCNYRVTIDDYRKRRLWKRRDEIRVRLRYYPQLGAGPVEYLRVVKSVVSGLLPVGMVRLIRSRIYRASIKEDAA
ncbi:glycosyltransferase [Microbacterium sp. NPDC057650]|uniref:glycosyltransferase n=1 Tax=unclassified Microbacterium TaxID=2609290 RepID=UPI00366BE30F